MTHRTSIRERASRPIVRAPWHALIVLLTWLGSTGCDGLFDVDDPGALTSEDLEDAELIESLSNSAEGALAEVLDDVIVDGGMVGDEVIHILSFDFAIPIDEGYMDRENAEIVDVDYNELSRARWVADEMVRRLTDLVDNPGSDRGIARSYFFGGIATLSLADLYREVTFDNQPPVTPAQAIDSAIARFDMAVTIAAADGDASLEAGAYGALARAYRSLYFEELHNGGGADLSIFAQAEEAAQQALAADPDYRVDVRYEQPGSDNGVYDALVSQRNDRMDPKFVNTMDPVSGEPDPRVEHSEQDGTGVRGDPIFFQQKYEGFNDDIPVARAAEAELIIAESRLLAGDLAGAAEWITRMRARSNLPPFTSSDAAEIQSQIVYERQVEFWLEGRGWPDHRYYEIVPNRWADPNKDAGVHRRWMVSRDERNANPYYRGQ